MNLVSLLLTYRWASPGEEERQAAVRYWKRALPIVTEIDFDGIMTSQAFAWEGERAVQSSGFMLNKMQEYVDKFWEQS